MGLDLSERQQKMLGFIREFIDDRHFPPTIREIGERVGITSTSVVKYNLETLERRGFIERDDDISRGIRLVESGPRPQSNLIHVPVLGRIAAGAPIPVPDSSSPVFGYDQTIELTRDIVKNEKDIYALQVQGNSMIDALIHDGDIVVMHHQERVENGELAAVWLRDKEETTLKRFYLEGEQVRLQPANPLMAPMFFPSANVQIMGKVLLVIRQLN
jgi:repressor LexA